jgi:hypothetical protein
MIKLPKFDAQAMYDYETNFHLTMNEERLAKFLTHYEAFKISQKTPGEIVECGVFKGTSLLRFGMMRKVFGGDHTSRLIAFDVFNDIYPNTKFKEDKVQRKYWIKTAGSSSISEIQLKKIYKKNKISNYQIIKGDVVKTVPKFIKKNPGIKISLLNIDIDFVEPTIAVLENLYDRVTKGGVILLDNYAGRGSSGKYLHGDTLAIDNFLKNKNIMIKKFNFAARPCFILKK